jgi:hypothetical protein
MTSAPASEPMQSAVQTLAATVPVERGRRPSRRSERSLIRGALAGSETSGDDVTAFDARDERVLFHVRVGTPPQHLPFDGGYAYLTSGYGGTIERVDAATGRVLRRTTSPYGSFELAAGDGYIATSSLLRGTLAIYTPGLKLLRVVSLAPATREVAISRPQAGRGPTSLA